MKHLDLQLHISYYTSSSSLQSLPLSQQSRKMVALVSIRTIYFEEKNNRTLDLGRKVLAQITHKASEKKDFVRNG
jgi:hypothetical protein